MIEGETGDCQRFRRLPGHEKTRLGKVQQVDKRIKLPVPLRASALPELRQRNESDEGEEPPLPQSPGAAMKHLTDLVGQRVKVPARKGKKGPMKGLPIPGAIGRVTEVKGEGRQAVIVVWPDNAAGTRLFPAWAVPAAKTILREEQCGK